MPIDPKRRVTDLAQALTLMVERLGDDQLMAFSPTDPGFESLAPTTWYELLDSALIENRGEKPGPSFRLTPGGWLMGLRLNGALEQPHVRERAITIRRALKARVKGRHDIYGARVDVRAFAEEIGLPVGWVWNAMRANLLQALFPNHQMNATFDQHQLMIRIPPTFRDGTLTRAGVWI